VVGAFVAATVVTLVQYLRVRDRRLLLLAVMFACQSQALGREWWDVWRDVFQGAVCAAGLGLVLAFSLHATRPAPRPPARIGEPGASNDPATDGRGA
jgi:hypothetical protein